MSELKRTVRCTTCRAEHEEDIPLCNLCGLTCALVDDRPEYGGEVRGWGGLLNTSVSGGYESTPGNGHGALDDGTTYRFSLCEFCLDWLFCQMRIPPTLGHYMGGGVEAEKFRPARMRVEEDEWRRFKAESLAEMGCRDAARRGK